MKFIAKKSFAFVPALVGIVTITKELKNPGHVDMGEELTIGTAEQLSDLSPTQKAVAAQLLVTNSVVDAANTAEVKKIQADVKAQEAKDAADAKKAAAAATSLEEKIAGAVTAALAAAAKPADGKK